uniref:FH2 domain-containing protein n=1 Tax=Alexandrium monilatum TaxID=311494 RepID=A0A7S4SIM0_9DINO
MVSRPFGTKCIRWRALQSVSGTVFEELGKGPLPAEAERLLREVLEPPPPTAARTPQSARAGQCFSARISRSSGISLLDRERAQSLGIIFKRFLVPFDGFCSALLQLKFSLHVSEEDIDGWLQAWPSEEEQQRLLDFKGSTSELRDVERNVWQIARVPRSDARLKLLRLAKGLENLREITAVRLLCIKVACRELLESARWREFLAVVLQHGNFINGSTGVGAQGFSPDALQLLKGMKGSTGASVLHCVCIFLAKRDQFFGTRLFQDLSSVPEAASYSLGTLQDMLRKLTKDLDFAEKELAENADSYMNLEFESDDEPLNTPNGICCSPLSSRASPQIFRIGSARREWEAPVVEAPVDSDLSCPSMLAPSVLPIPEHGTGAGACRSLCEKSDGCATAGLDVKKAGTQRVPPISLPIQSEPLPVYQEESAEDADSESDESSPDSSGDADDAEGNMPSLTVPTPEEVRRMSLSKGSFSTPRGTALLKLSETMEGQPSDWQPSPATCSTCTGSVDESNTPRPRGTTLPAVNLLGTFESEHGGKTPSAAPSSARSARRAGGTPRDTPREMLQSPRQASLVQGTPLLAPRAHQTAILTPRTSQLRGPELSPREQSALMAQRLVLTPIMTAPGAHLAPGDGQKEYQALKLTPRDSQIAHCAGLLTPRSATLPAAPRGTLLTPRGAQPTPRATPRAQRMTSREPSGSPLRLSPRSTLADDGARDVPPMAAPVPSPDDHIGSPRPLPGRGLPTRSRGVVPPLALHVINGGEEEEDKPSMAPTHQMREEVPHEVKGGGGDPEFNAWLRGDAPKKPYSPVPHTQGCLLELQGACGGCADPLRSSPVKIRFGSDREMTTSSSSDDAHFEGTGMSRWSGKPGKVHFAFALNGTFGSAAQVGEPLLTPRGWQRLNFKNSSGGKRVDEPKDLLENSKNSCPEEFIKTVPPRAEGGSIHREGSGAHAQPLEQLKMLVARGRVLVSIVSEQLAEVLTAIERCEKYFGGNSLDLPRQKDGKEAIRLFEIVTEVLKQFRSTWEEVHRDERWAQHLPSGPRHSSRSSRGELPLTAREIQHSRRRYSTPTPRRHRH